MSSKPVRSRSAHLLCATLAAVAILASIASSPVSAAGVTVAGTWSCCGSGGAAEQTWTIAESGGSLSGSAAAGGATFAPISGSLSGTSVTITTGPYTTDPGYSATFVGTISGETMSGAWTSNVGQSGSWTATRTTGSTTSTEEEARKAKEAKEALEAKEAKEKAAHRPTAIQVTCYFEFLTSNDTCTAQVADAGAPPAVVPTGTVRFASTIGSFLYGPSCSLKASSEAPSVPFCSVVLHLPEGVEFPTVSATYLGDPNHAPSEGHTQLLGAGLQETQVASSNGKKGEYPNEVTLETNVPANGTNVQVSADTPTTPLEKPPDPDSPLGKAFASIPRLSYEDYQYGYYQELRVGLEKLAYASEPNAAWTDWYSKWLSDWEIARNYVSAHPGEAHTEEIISYYKRLMDISNSVFEVVTGHAQTYPYTPPAKKSSLASLARTERSRHPHTLAFTKLVSLSHKNVHSGKLKLKLHLNRAALRRLAAKGRRTLTVEVWVRMALPTSVDPNGVPTIAIRHVTLHR